MGRHLFAPLIMTWYLLLSANRLQGLKPLQGFWVPPPYRAFVIAKQDEHFNERKKQGAKRRKNNFSRFL
ncbi:MAG: hypothetical protein LBD53_10640 [Tannerella sp.]|jgi:hypothetical protein|nr:hypothetical protein [Tannerella sp.]